MSAAETYRNFVQKEFEAVLTETGSPALAGPALVQRWESLSDTDKQKYHFIMAATSRKRKKVKTRVGFQSQFCFVKITPSPGMLFIQDINPALTKVYPDAKFTERGLWAGQVWAAQPAYAQHFYEKAAEALKIQARAESSIKGGVKTKTSRSQKKRKVKK
jgi:hypothetical protein